MRRHHLFMRPAHRSMLNAAVTIIASLQNRCHPRDNIRPHYADTVNPSADVDGTCRASLVRTAAPARGRVAHPPCANGIGNGGSTPSTIIQGRTRTETAAATRSFRSLRSVRQEGFEWHRPPVGFNREADQKAIECTVSYDGRNTARWGG